MHRLSSAIDHHRIEASQDILQKYGRKIKRGQKRQTYRFGNKRYNNIASIKKNILMMDVKVINVDAEIVEVYAELIFGLDALIRMKRFLNISKNTITSTDRV